MQADVTRSEAPPTTVRGILYFVLPVLVIVGALIAYKSSTALGVIGKVSATGVFKPRGTFVHAGENWRHTTGAQHQWRARESSEHL